MKTRRLASLLLLFAALLAVRPAAGQDVSVQAYTDATTIGAEEALTFTLEIKGAAFSDVKTPQAPATENLVLGQPIPSTQRNITISNGVLQQSIAYRWSYRPMRPGPARLQGIALTINGKTYRTEPIDVTVVPQSQRPQRRRPALPTLPYVSPPDQPAPEPAGVEADDLFIRATPSAARAYPNEQVTVEYRLFFRQGIQLRQSRLADSWDAEGFWREELDVESRPIPRTTVENGLRYNTIILKRVAVFPTHAGTLQIDPLRIESEAFLPSRASDPFEQFFSLRSRFETVEISSPAVRISTQPLPPDAPPDFNGAVGSFRLRANVNRTEMEVGEALEVRVDVTGTGNLATLTAPTFSAPGLFEVYDPQVSMSIERDGARIRGTKTFTYALVPRSNGTLTLPPITFSYFDPERKTYETLTTEPVPIRVTGTPGAPVTAAGPLASGLPVDDIAGLLPHDAGGWTRQGGAPLHRRAWPYAALALPLVALAGLLAYRRHRDRLVNDVEYARSRRAHPLARRHLREAERLLRAGQPRPFYEAVERAVLGFIGNRLNLAERGLTRSELGARLAAAGLPDETRSDVLGLLDACDRGRFAPGEGQRASLQQTYDRAGHLIARIDEQLNLVVNP